jgi:hypothetical protein
MNTLDILAMYTSLNHEEVVDIVKNIDSPSNGIIMEHNWHWSFDQFEICLEPVDHVSSYFSFGFPLTKLYIYREITLIL